MQRQTSYSRYGSTLMFLVGFAGLFIIAAFVATGFEPGEELWIGAAVVAVLISHARLGFLLNRERSEKEMVERLAGLAAVDAAPAALSRCDFEPTQADGMSEADMDILARVKEAVSAERVDFYLQPIVSLPQRRPRFYEAFSRLRDGRGRILTPTEYLDAAERANRINVIDNMILVRCVQALRRCRERDPRLVVFCNLSPATLFDRDFFQEFTAYLEANADLAPNLVFEFTYPAVHMIHPRTEKHLNQLARKGFAFSVDHIHSLDIEWDMLRDKNFRYAKASARLLLSAARGDDDSASTLATHRRRLADMGIDLIAEKVELETHMPEIISLGLDYGQGNLFGAPRPAAFYLGADDAAPVAGPGPVAPAAALAAAS